MFDQFVTVKNDNNHDISKKTQHSTKVPAKVLIIFLNNMLLVPIDAM